MKTLELILKEMQELKETKGNRKIYYLTTNLNNNQKIWWSYNLENFISDLKHDLYWCNNQHLCWGDVKKAERYAKEWFMNQFGVELYTDEISKYYTQIQFECYGRCFYGNIGFSVGDGRKQDGVYVIENIFPHDQNQDSVWEWLDNISTQIQQNQKLGKALVLIAKQRRNISERTKIANKFATRFLAEKGEATKPNSDLLEKLNKLRRKPKQIA